MRTVLVGLVLSGLIVTSGCGTEVNTLRDPIHVYGGVEFDCLALHATWLQATPDEPEGTTSAERFGKAVSFTAFLAMDLPLSFVADTIMLPGMLLFGQCRGWDWTQFAPPRPITTPDAASPAPVSPEPRSAEPRPGNQ